MLDLLALFLFSFGFHWLKVAPILILLLHLSSPPPPPPLQKKTNPNQEGDLILTGTPSGVGPVVPGDQVECLLTDAQGEELIKLAFTAVQREGGYRFQPED